MRNYRNANIKLMFTVICLVACFVVTSVTAYAKPATIKSTDASVEHAKKVTVAYIDYNNFIEAKNGTYSGYAADYLKRIAEDTGWEYEFVNMDWPTAYEAVKTGSIDFYCVARQTEERQSDFDFSLYPICNEEMNIYTMPNNDIYYQDYLAMNGKKVGMLENSGEIDYFKQYASTHDFSCDIIEYPMNEDAVLALENGEIDMIALVNYSVSDDYKLVGNFGVAPAYLMSCQGSNLMTEFSKAQEKLYFDDPNFSTELKNQYYGDVTVSQHLMLTREESDFINSLKETNATLTVAISTDMAPIEYYDYKTKSYKGLTIDLYKRISNLTGLSFNFVRRGNTETLSSNMKSGNIILTGAMAHNSVVSENLSIVQSKAFTTISYSTITNKIKALGPDSIVAIPSGYPQIKQMAIKDGYTNLVEYPTFEDCVRAVHKGRVDLTYLISLNEGYLLGHALYANLKSDVCEDSNYGISFGVYNEYDPRLVSIINKCISIIPSHEISDLLVTNTATEPKQFLGDLIIENGIALMIATIIVLILIAILIIWVQKNKQQVLMNKKLQQHRNYLQHLYDTLPCGVFRYEYDAPHKIISYNAACAKLYGYDKDFPIVGKTPDFVVEQGTEEAFQKKFDECIATGDSIIYEWPITRADGTQAFTESVMDIVETENVKVFQEVIIDITERKKHEAEIEKRYASELHRSTNHDSDLLYAACFDITEQILVETTIDVPGIHAGMTIDEFVEGLHLELKGQQSQEAMNDFKTRFTIERMNNEYENGHFEFSFDLCREVNGQIQWVRSNLALRYNPKTGHLMCFDYIYDVTDECVTDLIVRIMAFTDCENFVSVYLPTGRSLQYTVEDDNSVTRTDTKYMVNDILSCFNQEMTTQDALEFKEATALPFVTERLKDNAHYQVYATLHGTTETRQDKSISFFYTNEDGGVLAYTVVDVTDIRASEAHHAQLLADALAEAEKANEAKSRFLSSVSHELRTPLNAIIGFIELAKDAGNDSEKVITCLASSDIASKQLLNVINDVLDMSSIESGKLKIADSSFNFRHLISSITNIYGTQCKQKGVIFETRITTPMEDWLIGDELRVNQILLNILGNAVKFTKQGYITLTISHTELDNDKVFIHFTISDTGCGMTKEMKARLFKPFEQENASTARMYGGSGLGLSIVKNLVGLMDGKITVESEQGKGTTFNIDLPFHKNDVADHFSLPQKVDELHILTVDDEPSEREYMSLVLTRMGVRFKSVCGGDEALAELEKSEKENDLYNVCLIDWRMPDLDGCETTKRIREKYGKDLIVIVVSAYDFQQTEQSVAEAGANLFMTKPIFQSSLFDLFMTLTDGKIAKPKDEPQSWDFTGKRVLLAEDNTLNQIVAKSYLSKYNVVVDLAVDGKQALEMFEESESGFYDAILMDIQMPIMDGYEATSAIRVCKHPQAKTIPIIAQSADAFNEDIEKALSAGMNAHVSKPIKPDVLAKALHKAFMQNKDGEND